MTIGDLFAWRRLHFVSPKRFLAYANEYRREYSLDRMSSAESLEGFDLAYAIKRSGSVVGQLRITHRKSDTGLEEQAVIAFDDECRIWREGGYHRMPGGRTLFIARGRSPLADYVTKRELQKNEAVPAHELTYFPFDALLRPGTEINLPSGAGRRS